MSQATELAVLPPHVLGRAREKDERKKRMFDQMIVNSYEPGDGIVPHVDLMKFDDGVLGISLSSSSVMVFRPVESEDADRQGYGHAAKRRKTENQSTSGTEYQVLLMPGDAYFFWGEARYKWTHEIPFTAEDDVGSTVLGHERVSDAGRPSVSLIRGRRVSVTLRKLLPDV